MSKEANAIFNSMSGAPPMPEMYSIFANGYWWKGCSRFQGTGVKPRPMFRTLTGIKIIVGSALRYAQGPHYVTPHFTAHALEDWRILNVWTHEVWTIAEFDAHFKIKRKARKR